jgi:hypothetical protein
VAALLPILPQKNPELVAALPYEQGVCRTLALSFTSKSILRQKKNYGNSSIAT